MEILKVPAGPIVGKAYNYLLEIRLDQGPIPREAAIKQLLIWWKSQN
jgi:poly(A) polymerase